MAPRTQPPAVRTDVIVCGDNLDLLRALQERHRLAYVFISHDLRVVRALAHHAIVMKDGKAVMTAEMWVKKRRPEIMEDFDREIYGRVPKETPKVTGFIGNQRPQEVKPPHIEDLRKGITEGAVKPKPRQQFQEGDEVRVTVGAFANFSGTVQEVKPDKQKLKVMVSIFGRPTPVELDFSHVEKR